MRAARRVVDVSTVPCRCAKEVRLCCATANLRADLRAVSATIHSHKESANLCGTPANLSVKIGFSVSRQRSFLSLMHFFVVQGGHVDAESAGVGLLNSLYPSLNNHRQQNLIHLLLRLTSFSSSHQPTTPSPKTPPHTHIHPSQWVSLILLLSPDLLVCYAAIDVCLRGSSADSIAVLNSFLTTKSFIVG